MKIGIIGAGNVGAGLTKRLVPKGHSVMLSFRKEAAQLKSAAAAVGALAGTVAEAVEFGDVVVLATPWVVTADALKQVGKMTQKKILWDCTNALKPDMSGLVLGTTTSGGEEVANLAPWARVVKAIPPFAEVMHSSSMLIDGARPAVFVCSDDSEARTVVSNSLTKSGPSRLTPVRLRLRDIPSQRACSSRSLHTHKVLAPESGSHLSVICLVKSKRELNAN
jgi:8-hydroxy-5-deazaflavin:NADPH oxidoreductase